MYLQSLSPEGFWADMTDLPILAIVMVTYKRTSLAVETVRSFSMLLNYPKELRQWFIADDGSPFEHMQAIFDELKLHGETLYGYHNEKFGENYNAGLGWNRGLIQGHMISPIILFLEDDWELRVKLDISPYVRLLIEREDIGIVRLGHLAVGSKVEIVGYDGIHYLNYIKETPYAYSGNPHLRHRRFSEAYGMFMEDRNPGDMELAMDAAFAAKEGPMIWRPADIPGWGYIGHIGSEKSWA
jgi:hypothetical protein